MSPSVRARGTLRRPGADLARLPVAPELRAVNAIEGVRAGLAAAAPMAAAAILGAPSLVFAALGALLTCLADPGVGPVRLRAPLLAAFGLLGAGFYAGFGLLHAVGPVAVVAAALPALFVTSYVRVWGQAMLGFGNLLGVMILLGADETLSRGAAWHSALLFLAGSGWALLLAGVFWQLHPYAAARRAVADVWAELAAMAAQIRALAETDAEPDAWEMASRGSRAAVRAMIERARSEVMATLSGRGVGSGASAASQALVRLTAAEQLFPAMIALAELLEHADLGTRRAGETLLRRLRPLLATIAQAAVTDQVARPERLDRSIDQALAVAAGAPALLPVAQRIGERLRVATRLVDPAPLLVGLDATRDRGPGWRARLAGPLVANLRWSSASLRHAARVAITVTAALAVTLAWHNPYAHWLTITMVLVMQPFFSATWQRALERVAGTVLGGLVAAGLSFVLVTPLDIAVALPPLSAVALSLRQVSYALYVTVYTPVVVLLVDSIRPGQDTLHVAAMRAGITLAGGLLAVVANLSLWPSWEPRRVAGELRRALAAHAAYAQVALGSGEEREEMLARRNAGLATNNLEAAIARAMQEPAPMRDRNLLDRALVADAILRRIGSKLASVGYEANAATIRQAPLADWVRQTLLHVAEGGVPEGRPAGEAPETLERLARQTELLAEAVRGETG